MYFRGNWLRMWAEELGETCGRTLLELMLVHAGEKREELPRDIRGLWVKNYFYCNSLIKHLLHRHLLVRSWNYEGSYTFIFLVERAVKDCLFLCPGFLTRFIVV